MVLSAIKLILLWFEKTILKRKMVQYYQRKHIGMLLFLTFVSMGLFGLLIGEYVKHLTTLEIIYWLATTVTTVGFGDVNYNTVSLVEHDCWPILLLLQMFSFLVLFAMVASCITAIAEAYSNEKDRRNSIKNKRNEKDEREEEEEWKRKPNEISLFGPC